MILEKIIIKNFKKFEEVEIPLNENINILVGNNECGKSTILDAINLVLSGKLDAKPLMFNLTADVFNKASVEKYRKQLSEYNQNSDLSSPTLPEIYIELYAKHDPSLSDIRGKNNLLVEEYAGFKIKVCFNPINQPTYQDLLQAKKLRDLPIEFYNVEWKTFKGEPISIALIKRYCNVSLIDTSKNTYSTLIDSYVNNEISSILTEQEMTELGMAYRQNRANFKTEPLLNKLNNELTQKSLLEHNAVSLSLEETQMNEWKKDLSFDLDNIPYCLSGKGLQNIIKTNLALNKIKDKSNIILIEEPENHLSFTNMYKLIDNIYKYKENKQIFITTHSSFVANKIGVKDLIMINNESIVPFNNIKSDTIEYFKKLPGYNTLRVLLTDNPILVEGPSDELIIQRAYKDKYGKLPIEDGIDVISVDALAFKRFCDISIAIKKTIKILTDNDIKETDTITAKEKVENRYKAYIDSGYVKLYYEKNSTLNTLEPSILNANASDLGKVGTILFNDNNMDFATLSKKWQANKTQCALKIFESESSILYPEQINECIKK